MAQDAGQAGAQLPELVHVHRNVWEQVREERGHYREERDVLAAQVGQLTRTLRIRESDLAAMLDREREMAAQVEALTAERDEARDQAAVAREMEKRLLVRDMKRTSALHQLRAAWDALCRCNDEFLPDYPEACSERRDDLD